MMPLRAAPTFCVVCAGILSRVAGAGAGGGMDTGVGAGAGVRAVVGTGAREADAYPVCSNVACRMVVSRRAEMGEAGFKHYLQLQSRMTMERAANMQVAHARVSAEARENTAAWAALRVKALPADVGMDEGEGRPSRELLRLLVPSGPARARRLSQRRRARYRTHLLKLVDELSAPDAKADVALVPTAPANAPSAILANAPSTVSQNAPSSMPGHLCGLCGGGCCTHGGDHAYLSADTLRRVLAQQPAASAQSLVDDYLDRLPMASQDGSCINHTATGCALPVSLRSDICNNYACEALARLQHLQRTSAAPHVVLVVRRKQDNWQRKDVERDNSITARAVLAETGCTRYTGVALRTGGTISAADHAVSA